MISPEFKLRTSVSLSAKYVIAWELAKALNPSANIGSFSDFLSAAIIAYAKNHHPDLVNEAARAIQSNPAIVAAHKFFNAKNPTGKKQRIGAAPSFGNLTELAGGASAPKPRPPSLDPVYSDEGRSTHDKNMLARVRPKRIRKKGAA